MKVINEEVFAPVASVISCDDFEESLRQANDTKFGLQVGVFTKDIDRVLKAVKRLNFGGVIINDTPAFRADHMPYGGNRQSGLGREGVRFAMEDMTNIQMVAIRTGHKEIHRDIKRKPEMNPVIHRGDTAEMAGDKRYASRV